MTGQQAAVAVALAAALSAPAAAQKRPYDMIMKEVGSTFGTLRQTLESGDLSTVAAHTETLERLFRETEDFWTPFKTKDAIDAARGAREASATVAAAARGKDLPKARLAAAEMGRFCTACHASHREQLPDKSYRIKP